MSDRKQRARRYYLRHREKIIQNQRNKRKQKGEQIRQRDRERYWLNPQLSRAKRRAWSKANPDRQAAAKRRDWIKHHDGYLARNKKWRDENPHKAMVSDMRSRYRVTDPVLLDALVLARMARRKIREETRRPTPQPIV